MFKKKQNNEYGSVDAAKVIRKITKKIAHEPNLERWMSVFTAPMFQQIIGGINRIALVLIEDDHKMALENIFLRPDYEKLFYLVADLVLFTNNRVHSIFTEDKIAHLEMTELNLYQNLSEECYEDLERAQTYFNTLTTLVTHWLEQEARWKEWKSILANFIELVVIHNNTRYITKKFFFFEKEKPDPDTARYFITAQLQAFERIRDITQHAWSQKLNKIVTAINQTIEREF